MAADSVYRVTEVIGVSSESWAAAAKNGTVTSYRVRLGISFKYESGD